MRNDFGLGGCLYSVEWNGGMEYWNSGMPYFIPHLNKAYAYPDAAQAVCGSQCHNSRVTSGK